MQLKVGLKTRQELPREQEEKGIPDEAKALGKNADAGMDEVWREQGHTWAFLGWRGHWPRGKSVLTASGG